VQRPAKDFFEPTFPCQRPVDSGNDISG
jgi:hypothetical protein